MSRKRLLEIAEELLVMAGTPEHLRKKLIDATRACGDYELCQTLTDATSHVVASMLGEQGCFDCLADTLLIAAAASGRAKEKREAQAADKSAS